MSNLPATGFAFALLVAAACPTATADAPDVITQANHFATGFDESGTPLPIPAIDPAAIAYHPPSGHLFIADSEINEVAEAFAIVGANVFEVSPGGTILHASYDLTALGNNEPTGITYNAFDDRFYVSNDDAKTITRYAFNGGSGFALDDVVSTAALGALSDPEGITADPVTGMLYVIDGVGALLGVYRYDGGAGFALEGVFDLAALNTPEQTPTDPEGIAYDAVSGRLFLISDPDEAVYEFTTGGLFVAKHDVSGFAPAVVAVQGLTFGPTSDEGDDPAARSLFFADGGIDNCADPNERDGAVYEAAIPDNAPPVLAPIADQVVDEGSAVSVVVSASDADATDVLTFSLAGTVPEGATIAAGSGVFQWTPTEPHGAGDHLISVRVTDNGEPPFCDTASFRVTVSEVNEPPGLDPIGGQLVPVGTELTFTATAGDPDLEPALVNGLLAYWPFDADFASATGAHDGTGVDGARIEMAAGGLPLGGAALALDGVNDYVDIGVLPLPGDFTLAAWILPENIDVGSASDAVLLGDGANANWLRLEADRVRAKWNDVTTTVVTNPDFVNDVWQHVALVRAAGALTVYRNGAAAGAGAIGETFTPAFLGRKTPNTDNYGGMMDDVAVWSVPLTGEQISLLYANGTGRPVGDAGSIPANTLTFSLEGDVPPGASIDALTGVFAWTAPARPASFTFAVRVTDDGAGTLFAEETITVMAALPCPGDLDGDGDVGFDDLVGLLFVWGPCPPVCPEDLDGSGQVGFGDLTLLLAGWGGCP